MDVESRYNLITRNLAEIITKEELLNLLQTGKEIGLYWGTAPTASISVAYFFPVLKVADFLNAGLRVKILIADLHAALDGISWEKLKARSAYYEKAITLILKSINAPIEKLEFVQGSKMELNSRYFEDLLKMSMASTVKNCLRAASEVVKMAESPKLGNLIYPLMQALDEEHLAVDIQYAGQDQRKIQVYAREMLPKIGYKARIELMSPMVRGLVGKKMSSSVEATKIDLLSTNSVIKKKINAAECVIGDPENGIMSLIRYVVMVLKSDKNEQFTIERPEKYGGNIVYNTYEEIETDFIHKRLHPQDLKNSLAKELIRLLIPLQEDRELRSLYNQAYEVKSKKNKHEEI